MRMGLVIFFGGVELIFRWLLGLYGGLSLVRDVCGGETGWGVGYMEYGCLFRRLLVVGMGLSFLFGRSHVGIGDVQKVSDACSLQAISVSNQVMRFNRDDCQTIFAPKRAQDTLPVSTYSSEK